MWLTYHAGERKSLGTTWQMFSSKTRRQKVWPRNIYDGYTVNHTRPAFLIILDKICPHAGRLTHSMQLDISLLPFTLHIQFILLVGPSEAWPQSTMFILNISSRILLNLTCRCQKFDKIYSILLLPMNLDLVSTQLSKPKMANIVLTQILQWGERFCTIVSCERCL